MELHGKLVSNLESAVDSARRHRGRPVYPDTLQYWANLLEYAREVIRLAIDADAPAVRRLADSLEALLAER